MTLRLSPTEQRIVNQFKGRNMTVESVAESLGMRPATVRVRLGSIRSKDWNARSFHGLVNSLMWAYPSFKAALKVVERHNVIPEQAAKGAVSRTKRLPPPKEKHLGATAKKSPARTDPS